MGRSYYVAESVQKYLTGIQPRDQIITGLLIGQCSVQRDHIVLAVQTPLKGDPCEGSQKKGVLSKLEEIDEEWFCIHAAQISRMLPGGFLLAGVFLISPPEDSKESLNLLRKLVFAAEKFAMKNRLWNPTDEDVTDRVALQICPSTNKVLCRTFDVRDPKSTARPAEWRYQTALVSWLCVECNINVGLSVPLPSLASYQEQQRSTRTRLAQWAKELEDCTILFNGQLKDRDDLLEDQKKVRSAGSSGRHVISASVLIPSEVGIRRSARVEICNSSLNIGGAVRCRGYISSSKPRVKDAIQVISRDLLNTVCDRCDIMFEDLILNGSERGSEKSPPPLPLPQRVFLPLPGGAALCDYITGEESEEEVRSRLLEMLDQDVQYEDLEFPEEKTSCSVNESCDQKRTAGKEVTSSAVTSSVTPQSIGVVMAMVVVLLAILVYLLR